jgi:hypothetical protein
MANNLKTTALFRRVYNLSSAMVYPHKNGKDT